MPLHDAGHRTAKVAIQEASAMNATRRNDSDHIRRNPQDSQGKLRAGGGDLIGDEDEQVAEWDELIAEEQGQYDSRIEDVGNAQDALLGGTGDLDRVHDTSKSEIKERKAAAEDDPDVRRGDEPRGR
jgi:hypothetical protein